MIINHLSWHTHTHTYIHTRAHTHTHTHTHFGRFHSFVPPGRLLKTPCFEKHLINRLIHCSGRLFLPSLCPRPHRRALCFCVYMSFLYVYCTSWLLTSASSVKKNRDNTDRLVTSPLNNLAPLPQILARNSLESSRVHERAAECARMSISVNRTR